MTTTDTPTTEITIVVPEKDQLPPSLLSNIETGFKESFAQAEKWRTQALAIHITSADQKPEMQQARIIRLALKNTRVAADKKRKELKADALLMGRAIDGVYNLLEAAIVPLERHLEEQEKFAERLAEAERQRVKAEREHALSPYLDLSMPLPALDAMSDEQFTRYLEDSKILHNAKLEAARKAEADRIAREQAEAAERERLRIENEKLRQEAQEREAAAKGEREAFEKSQREAAAKAKKEQEATAAKAKAEREAFEAEQRAIREESERRLAAERAEAAQRQRIADEAAAKERAAIQAKADQERKEALAVAEKARNERMALEKQIAADKLAREQFAKAEAAAQRKANRAPDKQKALTFAATVRTLKAPTATTEEGKAVMAEIAQKIEGFAKWITVQAESL